MILCVGTTPAVQRVMRFEALRIDAVNRAVTTLDGVAGKSINVARVLQALEASPVAVGFLGGDRGLFVRSLLDKETIANEFVDVSERTRECVTVIDTANGTTTELVEESRPVSRKDADQLLEVIRRRAGDCRAMVMSGTVVAGAGEVFYAQCVAIAQEAGVMSVIDGRGEPLTAALSRHPDVVKPNLSELETTVGRRLPDEAAVMEAMKALYDQGAQQVVITAGKDPIRVFDGDRFHRVIPPAITPVNPIGSGDAVTAALSWRLVEGDSLLDACRWGCAAGTANALTPLAGDVNRRDAEKLLPKVNVEAV